MSEARKEALGLDFDGPLSALIASSANRGDGWLQFKSQVQRGALALNWAAPFDLGV
jgi:hypothetical protein